MKFALRRSAAAWDSAASSPGSMTVRATKVRHTNTHTIANLSQTPAVWVSVCCPWVTLVKCWVRVFRFRWLCVCVCVLVCFRHMCLCVSCDFEEYRQWSMKGWKDERREESVKSQWLKWGDVSVSWCWLYQKVNAYLNGCDTAVYI